ncbi:MAG: hypothetical protein V1860_02830, partial [bacterium]
GIFLLALFKISSAAWEEPAAGCSPPDCNRPSPLYSQNDAQAGPLNVKDMTAGSGKGTIEANKICLCNGADGTCASEKCITSWSSQGLWTKDAVTAKIYYNYANVGIGTDNPAEKLEISAGAGTTARLRITDTDAGENAELQLQYGTGGGDHWALYNNQTNDALTIWGGGDNRLAILQSGNVGIGTTNPSEKLEVVGTIKATKFIGDGSGLSGIATGGETETLPTGTSGQTLRHNGTAWIADSNLYNNGNIGIGTETPAEKLEISAGAGTTARLRITDAEENAEMQLQYGTVASDHWAFYNNKTNDALTVWGGGDNRLTILQNGNVGIGATDPIGKLEVAGQVKIISGEPLIIKSNNSDSAIFVDQISTGYACEFNGILKAAKFIGDGSGLTGIATGGETDPLPSGISGQTLRHNGTSWIADSNLYNNGTNIGIGTETPAEKMQISAGAGTSARLRIADMDANENAELQLQYGTGGNDHWSLYNNQLTFRIWGGGADRFTILQNGNVGIGTIAPSEKLEVAGAAEITGDLTVGGKFNASGADLAEEFASVVDLPEGTVVVIGDDGYKSVKPSNGAYDKKVVGVVSDNPSIIMGRIKGNEKEVIAIKGVITVKATNKNGNIEKGNLLTSSEIEGRAMKVAEVKLGTIIGKALEDCISENCDIKAIINLR